MKYFLLIYDRSAGEIKDIREFGDAERARALQERFALERSNRTHPELEIVLLAARSLEALKVTHSRYFKTPGELAEAL